MKVGNVTERTDGGSSTRFDADELDRAGIDLGATGRLQLMFKLAEGTGLQVTLFYDELITYLTCPFRNSIHRSTKIIEQAFLSNIILIMFD